MQRTSLVSASSLVWVAVLGCQVAARQDAIIRNVTVIDVVHGRAMPSQTLVITGDKITCVYLAANEELIRQHASRGGFPATRISEVKAIIDPSTAG